MARILGIRGWTVGCVLVLLASACGGSSTPSTERSSGASDADERTEQVAEEPTATAVPAPTATVVPEPTATPEPTPTPNPDIDGDGVVNEADDFPEDPARAVALVSAFPLVDGVNQLDESLPSVQGLREIQALVLAGDTDSSRLGEVFAPSFLQSFTAATVAQVIDQTGTAAGETWEVVDVRAVTEWWLWVQMGDPANAAKPTQLVRVGLDPNTNLINEFAVNDWRLGLGAQQYPADRTKSLDAVIEDLSTKTDLVGVLVADVSADGCSAIAAHNEDIPLGTASVYKQWVLGAAATEIEAGRLDPTQLVNFTPGEYMSGGALTTGQFASSIDLTLQQAANLMMNRSDNGATDMVERTVGRPAAWEFVATSGHTDPDILNPIIGIRDYDHLYSSVSPAQVGEFLNGTEEEQEAFVVDVLDPLGPIRLGIFGNQNTREYTWQASPTDICETMATLANRFSPDSAAGQFIDEAFSGEAALFGVRNEWDRVWYKGGSIPGGGPGLNVILTHATLVQSNDGRAHAIIVMFNSDAGFSTDPLQFEAASLMSRIHELLVLGN